MRVLITGAAGMYGITLTRRLLADDPHVEVIGVDDFSRQYPGQDPLTVEAARCDRLTVVTGDFADLSHRTPGGPGARRRGALRGPNLGPGVHG